MSVNTKQKQKRYLLAILKHHHLLVIQAVIAKLKNEGLKALHNIAKMITMPKPIFVFLSYLRREFSDVDRTEFFHMNTCGCRIGDT